MDLWALAGRAGGAVPATSFSNPSASKGNCWDSKGNCTGSSSHTARLGGSDAAKPQRWLHCVAAQFSPCCLKEEQNQLAQLMKRDLLKAEGIIPPDFPGISGSVNAEVVLLQEESLKVSDYCELGMQQSRNLSSLLLLSKRSGLNRPRAQIFSCQRPGLTAARLCLYRMALCNPALPTPQKGFFQ